MKKIISRTLLLSMLLYLCLPIANFVYAKENTKVIINDVYIDDNACIENISKKLYVSARSIADPMGLNLDWNDINKTLRISYQDTIITLITASDIAIVNGTPIETEQPLKIMSDRAIVDLCFVCNALEAPVTFDETKNAYSISIDVPEDFQPDVIKTHYSSDEISLFSDDTLEITKVKDIAKALELETAWNDTEKSITLTSKLGDTLALYVGADAAWFNGCMVDCPDTLRIIDDEAYIKYEFIESFFAVPTQQNYVPARLIADELGIDVEWIDETKTVQFINETGDRLCMSIGSVYYTLNDKYYNNSAPLALEDGVALTNKAVVEDAFLNHVTDNENDELTLFSNTKDFSGQLILEKSFSSQTRINVTVISVQSIVYTNSYGYTYRDSDTETITVPANTKSVDFCVTKTNCSTYDSYIIGYSFINSNSYYYGEGYLSSGGGIITDFSEYPYYYYYRYDYYSTSSDIVLRPKVYSGVALDDVVFSGTIKTANENKFGTGSSLMVSVCSITYYSERAIASEKIYPGNTSSAEFSVSVPNNSSTRNNALYLRYNLYDGNDNIVPSGYYKSSTSSVKSIDDATSWNICYDVLSNISFKVITKVPTTINGSFYMPDDMKNESNADLSLGIDILTVQNTVYSNKMFYDYISIDNVATIKPGESNTDYALSVILEDNYSYIIKYRLNTPYGAILPYGYATTNSNTIDPDYATIYSLNSNFNGVDFWMQSMAYRYNYINNLPYRKDSAIKSSSDLSERDSYYEGYSIYLEAGQTITIEMKSGIFDSYLYLLDDSMQVIAYDDDGLGNRNSKIRQYIYESGYYYIQATTYYTSITGKYLLTIKTDKRLSGSVIFTDDDQDIVQNIGNNSVIQANYIIQNTDSTPEDIYLFMALYDTNNLLIKLAEKKISVSDFSDSESLSLNLKGIANAGVIKAFIWTDALEPISKVDCLY